MTLIRLLLKSRGGIPLKFEDFSFHKTAKLPSGADFLFQPPDFHAKFKLNQPLEATTLNVEIDLFTSQQ